jgi:ferric-dicitrate binding protein FerR (iron transport regulator)
MTLPPARRRRRRLSWLLLLYVLVLIAGAVALWLLVPQEVKKAIYETYVNP